MGIFNKKNEDVRLPDLPGAPMKFGSMSMDDDLDSEGHVLPTFPDSPTHNKFSQAAIKDAVGESELEEVGNVGGKNIKLVEMDEWRPEQLKYHEDSDEDEEMEMSRPEPIRRIPPLHEPMQKMHRELPPKNTDIFVRLDKFHAAKKSLSEVKDKLAEIDDMIRKIRETKLREDQELSAWEHDMIHIKSRIQDVTENIFEKVE